MVIAYERRREQNSSRERTTKLYTSVKKLPAIRGKIPVLCVYTVQLK